MKTAQKFVFALFALCVIVTWTACDQGTTRSVSLAERGLGLINEVHRLAQCKEYISLFSSSEEIANVIENIAGNDYQEPKAVFVIEDLDAMVFESMLPDVKLPADVIAMTKGRFAKALPSQINAMNGAMNLAATSILSHDSSFIDRNLTDSITYLYTYDKGHSFMIAYTSGEEDIVNASVSIVVNDELSKCSTKEDVVRFFHEALSLEDVPVSALAEEK